MPNQLVRPKGLDDTGLDRLFIRSQRWKASVRQAVLSAGPLIRTMDGASTFEITLDDPNRDLIRSRLVNQSGTVNLDGLMFEYVAYRKGGNALSLTFEDALVNDLRHKKGPLVAPAGTSTRTAFARRLVGQIPYASFSGEATEKNLVALARGKHESSWQALTRLAEERKWRCFSSEGKIYFGSDDWLAGTQRPFVISEDVEGIDTIDPEYDGGKRATACTVECWANRWAAHPGAPVHVEGLGHLAGRGMWLVQTIERPNLFSKKTTVRLVRKTPDLPEPLPESHPGNRVVADGGIVRVGHTIESLRGGCFSCSEHPAFGGVHPVHDDNSHHYDGDALDINWKGGGGFSSEREALAWLAQWILDNVDGVIELYWPDHDPVGGHDTHLHLALSRDGGLLVRAPSGVSSGDLDTDIPAESVKAKIRAVFGKQGENGIRVGDCESDLVPTVTNSYVDDSGKRHIVRGIFQISDVHRDKIYPASEEHRLLEVDYNINAAYRLYQRDGWEPWTCAHKLGIV